jgi:hypothetical protein
VARVVRLRRNVGWITLPRNLLEQQLDALGLERNRFETGVMDGDEVIGMENLNDYPDYPSNPEDALVEGPSGLPTRGRFAPVPQGACRGSRQPLNGDTPLGPWRVRCSVCGGKTVTYLRRDKGLYRCSHLLPVGTESEDLTTAAKSSKS